MSGLFIYYLLATTSLTRIWIIQGAGHVAHVLVIVVVDRLERFFGLFFHRELDSIYRGFGAQVVHTGFQAAFPSVEVHRRQFTEIRVLYVQV